MSLNVNEKLLEIKEMIDGAQLQHFDFGREVNTKYLRIFLVIMFQCSRKIKFIVLLVSTIMRFSFFICNDKMYDDKKIFKKFCFKVKKNRELEQFCYTRRKLLTNTRFSVLSPLVSKRTTFLKRILTCLPNKVLILSVKKKT